MIENKSKILFYDLLFLKIELKLGLIYQYRVLVQSLVFQLYYFIYKAKFM